MTGPIPEDRTERRMITKCGWCTTILPNDDYIETEHHFLTVHRIIGGSSLRYFYPDDIEDEFHRWEKRAAAHGEGWAQ